MDTFKDKITQISLQHTDRLAPFVLLLLILVLCWKLASLFWWVVAPPQVLQSEQVGLGSQQPQVPNISGFSLFQEVGATASNADANLVLILQGVIVASPRSNSSAVIKVNEVADRYVIGQTLEGSSFQLAEVYWDRVVLSQGGGATRELQFSGIENLNQPMVPEQNDSLPNNSIQNNSMSSSNSQPSNTVSPIQNSNQNSLGQAIDKIQENRDQYLKGLGVNTTGGQGYEVTDQTPAALRNKLGLRSGDRILSLNGQAVGQGQSDVQLLEQAKKEGKVRIEVKRGDQVMTFQQEL